MLKRLIIIGVAVVVAVVAVIAVVVLRPPEQASGPIQAIPLAATAPAQEVAPTAAQSTAESTAVPETDSAATAVAPTPAGVAAATGNTASPTTFEIVPAESQASFVIDEVLRGAPKTVVGTTDQVAGQIAIDPNNLSATQVGVIQVNARTLTTDAEPRNRAIKNFILNTNEYEFVIFTPTSVSGLPEAASVGQSYTFQISGDLTVKGITKPATFDVSVTAVSPTRIEGTASTQILYRDFELAIPDSPAVDTVADEVILKLDFVAQALS